MQIRHLKTRYEIFSRHLKKLHSYFQKTNDCKNVFLTVAVAYLKYKAEIVIAAITSILLSTDVDTPKTTDLRYRKSIAIPGGA